MRPSHRQSKFLHGLNHARRRCLTIESLEERRVMTTELISSDSNGVPGNNGSILQPAVSGDGRYVVFSSFASNLVVGDNNNSADIFMKDVVTGVTKSVSSARGGQLGNNYSFSPSISSNGRYVAFRSDATNLVAGDTNNSPDIFLKDTRTGGITRVSTNSTGREGNGSSFSPKVSANGRYIAFESDSSNLVEDDTNNSADIFVKDTLTGSTVRVSTDSTGQEGNAYSLAPSISADGRHVGFESFASNFVAGDINNSRDVFLKDIETGVVTRISDESAGRAGNANSFASTVSGDAFDMAYTSSASNLVKEDTNRADDIFLRDTLRGTTTHISTDSSGIQANSGSFQPIISSNGQYVAFISSASNLVSGDNNERADVFIKDRYSGVTALISRNSFGELGNGDAFSLAMSADGRYVIFGSNSSNLVPADTNNTSDLFRVENPLLRYAYLYAKIHAGKLSIADISVWGFSLTVRRADSNLEISSSGDSLFFAAPVGTRLSDNDHKLTIPLSLLTNGIYFDAGAGNNFVTIDTTDLAPTILAQGVHINFGDGQDTLMLINKNTNNVWTIDGKNSGNVKVKNTGLINFYNLEYAAGGTGNDVFRITSVDAMEMYLNTNIPGGVDSLEVTRNADFTLSNSKLMILNSGVTQTFMLNKIQMATLTGGIGNNVINARGFAGPVRLNGGAGNDILLGGFGNDILNGGLGDDWLSGNDGDDTLLGWNGRDILVGGLGADKLNGSAGTGSETGDDILIGGTTTYDLNRFFKNGIQALLASWAKPAIYTGHIAILTRGFGPFRQYKLNITEVLDDNAIDILIGGGGLDWFFVGTRGTNKDTHDKAANEQVVEV